MENLPKSFLAWHYTISLPKFINDRLEQVLNSPKYFNVPSLLKNFFAPYRRLAVVGKSQKFGASGLFDKITFNLTSIFVGASVRTVLLVGWILVTFFLAIFGFLAVALWTVLPFLSLPTYLELAFNTFFEDDLKDSNSFLKKLEKTKFFNLLAIFFDKEFLQIFTNVTSPNTLGLSAFVKPDQVILTLYKKWPPLKKYLEQNNLNQEDFELLFNYLVAHLETPPKKTVFSLGQSLAYGYTNILDQYAVELTSLRLASPTKKALLDQIGKVLTRPQNNNVILVGEPGVGKHNTLQELAAAIARGQLPALTERRVMLLDSIALASAGENLPDTKSAFETAFAEAKAAGNIILAVDHIDRLASAKEGRIDITDVLTTILTNNSLPIIGITTPDEFNLYIRPNGNFASLFEKIDIEEASVEETTNILIGKTIETFSRENMQVNYPAIIEIAEKSGRLILDRKQPQKSIILFDDAIAETKSRKLQTVDITLVDEVLSKKTKTPIGKIAQGEAEKLKNLEVLLHKRVIGQNQAIDAIARAMRRARAEIESGNRPIGSFLFLGPTGVGKTETAKALAEAYFGLEDRMVRLDMSEFQEDNALERLIGEINTQRPGQLATLIRENPYGLLLVDEFEKANRNVHNLFLQILDEGFLTDAFGKKVSFDNVIIIATSNAGAEFIREQITEGQVADLSKKLVDFVLSKGLFTPELINRFDGVIVYHPLAQDQVVLVTQLMLTRLAKQLKDSKNIDLEVTGDLAKIIAQKGFDPTFGARPIRRLIQDKIEDGIAKMIIEGSAKSGSTITASTLLNFLS